jgi:metal-responsive CopG/Arc/MetJ family transcriptional regulator
MIKEVSVSPRASPRAKITVSLPQYLVRYVDERATALGISRSQVIGQAVAKLQTQEKEQLAQEGYLFYAAEAAEFAGASQQAVFDDLARAPG